MKAKNLINSLIFILIVGILLWSFSYFLNGLQDNSDLRISMFSLEEQDTLDLVAVGSSTTKAGYIPAQAYQEYGIKSYNYSLNCIPFEVIPYMLREINSKQENATILLDLTSISTLNLNSSKTYATPFLNSLDKKTKNKILKEVYGEEVGFEQNIPLYNNHSNWKKIKYHNSFKEAKKKDNSKKSILKGWSASLNHREKETNILIPNNNTHQLTIEEKQALDKLHNTIQDLNCRVVFYIFPKFITDYIVLKQHYIAEKAKEYMISLGHTVIDVSEFTKNEENIEDGKIVFDDFYDFCHLNIEGAQKFTTMICQALIDNNQIQLVDVSQSIHQQWQKDSKKTLKYMEKIDDQFKKGKNLSATEKGVRNAKIQVE